MLILPQFQRLGIGSKLLRTIYQHYWSNCRVKDITGKCFLKETPLFLRYKVFSLDLNFLVEDPSDDFIRLRDRVDVTLALEMIPAFGTPDGAQCFSLELQQVQKLYSEVNFY